MTINIIGILTQANDFVSNSIGTKLLIATMVAIAIISLLFFIFKSFRKKEPVRELSIKQAIEEAADDIKNGYEKLDEIYKVIQELEKMR